MSGPLDGVRIVELAGIGPAPHAAMHLADQGATVVRVERPGARIDPGDPMMRGRSIVRADLKDPADLSAVRELIAGADVLIEGFRPGVLERLGLAPADLLQDNPRLIVGRMTGWGQAGEFAQLAGHDINYISAAGALHMIGPADAPPPPPVNFVGDYAAGSMMLVNGILAALYERERSGRGQIIDVAMVDGTPVLMQMMYSLLRAGQWADEREANLLDGAAPFYRTYTCADGQYMAVGAIEPQFYALLLDGLGLDPAELPPQMDREAWPRMHELFEKTFAQRSRDEWAAVFAGTDACATPVLTMAEAATRGPAHERGSVTGSGTDLRAGTAPRFSRSTSAPGAPARDASLSELAHDWST